MTGQNFAFDTEFTPSQTRQFLKMVTKAALKGLGLF
jgi:hypothetical protein